MRSRNPGEGEPLGRDVEQPHVARTARSTARRLARASCCALTSADAPGRHALERLDLVLHQRHQRRDHERQVRPHQRRQLVAERLARAGGHHHQHVAAAGPASTASRWPGRNAGKPNSSCSAPSDVRARAHRLRRRRPEARREASDVREAHADGRSP
jgi:hypothetical protein